MMSHGRFLEMEHCLGNVIGQGKKCVLNYLETRFVKTSGMGHV